MSDTDALLDERDAVLTCAHEHWYEDETLEGERIHICEDCDDFVYVRDIEREEP